MTSSNPLLSWIDLPDFPRITAEHVMPAMQEVIAQSTKELEYLEQSRPTTWHALLVPLERLTDRVSRIWGVISHLHNVKNSPEMRQVYAEAQPLVVDFFNRLGQSRPIYDRLLALRAAPEFPNFSLALQRTITLLCRDANLQGVGLSEDQRTHFNAICQELADLTTSFTNNVLDATQAYTLLLTEQSEVSGLPHDSLQLAASMARIRGYNEATPNQGPWAITLDLPSFLSFMQFAARRDLREQVYRAYITRASHNGSDNTPLIIRILTLRKELATLLDFPCFADMSLARKMAESVSDIQNLLETIRKAATDPALTDLIDLGELAHTGGQIEEIQPWDVMYWAERLKETRLGIRDDELRPYFPLPAVLQGLFTLIDELFGVTLRPRSEVAVWHDDVTYYDIVDGEKIIGGLFLDLYARPAEKRGGAWMDDLVGRSVACASAGQSVRLPVAYINCNQRPGLDGAPALMSFQEMVTLFHEFGHALQHTLTQVCHGFVAGISNIEWDAVELPSQFMENWCYEPTILRRVTRHYQSGEPLSLDIVEKLQRIRSFRAGANALRQVTFALTDLTLHTEDPKQIDPHATAQYIARSILPLSPLPEDRSLCTFSHIFAGGYAAGYYSYKWAEVLSADAYAAFIPTEPASLKEQGGRFRATVLALGGSRHPMDVFSLFRGRKPDPDALLRQEGLNQAGAN